MGVRLPIVPLGVVVAERAALEVPLESFDTLWLQLTGTLCNIACLHCFITCGPDETRVPMMATADVLARLSEAESLGVREYYFTGGEPMLHPDFFALCQAALVRGPLTVLTNAMLIDDAAAARLRALSDESRYSFELRVSLDGMSAAENDPVRGKGTFEATTLALTRLARVALQPIVTVVEHRAGLAAAESRAEFLQFARELGLSRPRVKFMPLLHIGREERRTRGYLDDELDVLVHTTTAPETLVCRTSRLVTANGVMTCPILLDAPEAKLGERLSESMRPIRLRWSACRTCVADGLSCAT